MRADNPLDWANRAERLIRAGDKSGALAALLSASQAQPASAASEDRIGFLFAVLQRQQDAVDHFQKALNLDPRYAAAHYHLGVALWLANESQEGISELQEAAKLAPAVFDYRYRLGSAYLQSGAFPQAAAELKQAVSIDGSKTPAWIGLGRALQNQGDLDGAVNAFDHAVKLAPEDDNARNEYAYVLIETRRADRGIEESRRVLLHKPNDTSAWMNIGYADLKKGDFAAAEKAYRKSVEIDATLAAAHYDLGIALKMEDQLEAAQKELKDAIRLDPSLAQAHYTLGITYWQMGDFPATLEQMPCCHGSR